MTFVVIGAGAITAAEILGPLLGALFGAVIIGVIILGAISIYKWCRT